MRYITIGVLVGFLAGYAVEAFFPFKSTWGAAAMVACIVVGIIAQCRAIKETNVDEGP